jgi:predicted nucleic acid-binding protein
LKVYVDSSFLVSLYLTDSHSLDSRRRVHTVSQLWFTALHRAEWAHALAQHVFRGVLPAADAPLFDRQLESDRVAGLWREAPLPDHALDLCVDLARRHGPKLGVRTLDSLHVACALEFKATRFWTFDDRQAKLARAVGLKIT